MIFEMSCNDTGCGIDDQCQPDQVWINPAKILGIYSHTFLGYSYHNLN